MNNFFINTMVGFSLGFSVANLLWIIVRNIERNQAKEKELSREAQKE